MPSSYNATVGEEEVGIFGNSFFIVDYHNSVTRF